MTYWSRTEVKYMVHWNEYEKIKRDLKPFLLVDKNAAKDNKYKVLSLYYDSPNRKLYFEKIDGFDFRYKLRIRTYLKNNIPDTTFVEIKKRNNKQIFKSRVNMTMKEARDFIADPEAFDLRKYSDTEQLALKEISYLKHIYNLIPVAQISYCREPYTVKYASNLRITFDTSIKFINEQKPSSGFREGYVIDPQWVIIEVKHRGLSSLIPPFIKDLVEKHNLQMTTYSKYCEGVIKVRGTPP